MHKQLNILFEEHFVRSKGKGKGGESHVPAHDVNLFLEG